MEPERQIEKLLRAVAKKRRDQAGDSIELKDAARRQLHAEIARRANRARGTFLENLFAGLYPRLAFALCVLALVLVGGGLLMPALRGRKPGGENFQTLASLPARTEPAPTPTLAPPPPAAPEVAIAEGRVQSIPDASSAANSGAIPLNAPASDRETIAANSLAEKKLDHDLKADAIPTNSLASTFAAASSPAGAGARIPAATPPSGSLADRNRLDTDGATETRRALAPSPTTSPVTIVATQPEMQKSLALDKVAVAPSAASATFDYNRSKAEALAPTPVVSQRFNRLESAGAQLRGAGAASVPPRVLASFAVEQNGQQIRVTDADGSVYLGALQSAPDQTDSLPAPSATRGNVSASQFAKTPPPQLAAGNYFFRVAGTNRNLKQNVVFSGNLIPLTNTLIAGSNLGVTAGGFGGGGGGSALHTPQPTPTNLVFSNSRISGKVSVGNRKEVEVNAVPAQ